MRYRGISLVETVVVIAITAAVSGALLSAIRCFYVNNEYVIEATTAVENARRGLALSLSELREASYGDDGAYPVESAATSSVTFYSDTDTDGAIEKVKIWAYNGSLYTVVTNSGGNPPTYTGQASATTSIVSDLRNGTSTPVFTYFDSSGAQLSTSATPVASIATVKATVQIDINPNRAPQIYTLYGSATLRNLRD
jgi:hypothetical protein